MEEYITIRPMREEDLPALYGIYATARQYMRDHGNDLQWGDTDYPEGKLKRDIEEGTGFVGVDENGAPCFAFAFIVGDDPTYRIITKGQWLNDRPYGTIHRLASNGKVRRVFDRAFAFAKERIGEIRCDTHEVNATMRHVMERAGLRYCGIIFQPDGSERVAYHYSSET